ncbi:MOSC N-terminal beta barrel domain-containing protein [Microbacterium sp. TPD7012]|uniref:MOSC domain-containing protein n=1 Tax=Microbacterium sp. TPD7012 TaxID=2171975 RepID=UPI000D51BC4E|nr:MOSC N-terminal beta barrel domain-containing protein [Microbacterium sp. TPD7012]PVE96651.1 MOSC domain-containing protein [Microbacterium sp. TPD7012]
MARVVALYRHPIKGLTPESLESLTVQADGRVAGDRVLAFRFADAVTPEDDGGLDYWPKSKGLALQDFPALAALRTSYDDASRRLRIEHDGRVLAEAGIDDAGRAELVAAVTDFTLSTREGRRLQRPGRLPLALVGDGETSRFQDRARGYVSVHSRGSTLALSDALDLPVDDRRFRSNIVIDGVAPWSELDWEGEVRIGTVAFRTAGPIVRCLATHANPDTGVRDAKVLTTLTGALAQGEPTLGRLLLPTDETAEGIVRLGDEVLTA